MVIVPMPVPSRKSGTNNIVRAEHAPPERENLAPLEHQERGPDFSQAKRGRSCYPQAAVDGVDSERLQLAGSRYNGGRI